MKIKRIKNIIPAILGLLFLSCNPKVEVPAYIYIDVEGISFVAESEQGSASSKITDVQVTVILDKMDEIGTYKLPALFPVIAEGNTELIFWAGIKLNGLSQQRTIYPLYKELRKMLNLKKGQIDTISLEFSYYDNVKFPLIENFESAGLKFSPIEGSAELKKTNVDSFLFHHHNEANSFSGKIELPASDSIYFFEIRTAAPLNFNATSAKYCFVELNFCFTENVEIGMYCHYPPNSSVRTQQVAIVNIKGEEKYMKEPEWNKIYVNLTKEMVDATAMGMTHFDIYMKSGIQRGKTARFLFDNIKIAHH